jgi:hypothetical protein
MYSKLKAIVEEDFKKLLDVNNVVYGSFGRNSNIAWGDKINENGIKKTISIEDFFPRSPPYDGFEGLKIRMGTQAPVVSPAANILIDLELPANGEETRYSEALANMQEGLKEVKNLNWRSMYGLQNYLKKTIGSETIDVNFNPKIGYGMTISKLKPQFVAEGKYRDSNFKTSLADFKDRKLLDNVLVQELADLSMLIK